MHNRCLVLLVLLAAGCGVNPAAPTLPTAETMPLPLPPHNSGGVAAPMERQLLTHLAQALNSLQTMDGQLHFEEWSDDGKYEYGNAEFRFRRTPFAARVDVEDSNRPLAVGSTVLWDGGDQVQVKHGGIPIVVSLAADNSLVTSIRGWRLDQTDIFSMGRVLLAPGAHVRFLGMRSYSNGSHLAMQVESPASNPEVTGEIIGLDPQTYLPTYREVYVGNRLVERGEGSQTKTNVPLLESLFSF